MTKICTKCNTEKPLDNFAKDKNGKYGVKSKCKECIKNYMTGYNVNNQDKIKEYNTINQDKISKWNKNHYINNREHYIEKNKQYGSYKYQNKSHCKSRERHNNRCNLLRHYL